MDYKDGNGQNLTDNEIADNIIGVLFAAQDTTASALTWVLKFLHDNPKLLEAIKVSAWKSTVSNSDSSQSPISE